LLSISIVTPSLNQGRFIERTIRSVLDQNYPALEYVVCDGGSTDQTLSVLDLYRDRLRAISEPDGGQAAAVNKGIRMTSGEIIGWLNSDDVYCPGSLRSVAEFMMNRPAIDVVYGDACLIDADGGPLGPYETEPWDPARLTERCFLCQPAVLFRRRVVERFGLLDDRLHYCMDYEYWLRLATGVASFAHLPVALAGSRLHPETKTLGSRAAVHAELNTMLRARLGRVPDSWLLSEAHTLVELRRARARPMPYLNLMPYALEVVLQAARLSRNWNASVPRSLLVAALGPVASGARRRLNQSRHGRS
jgi:glycosyltransferase involved in cell wall biosynthesis